MKKITGEFFRRALLMVLPFLLLVAVTIAWFVNSPTTLVGEMTFASGSSGAGATVYAGTVDPSKRVYTKGSPDTVKNTVTWATAPMKDSTIAIENLEPGQCVFFKLSCQRPASVSIANIQQFDKDGKPVTDKNVQLADYLGLYAVPIASGAATSDVTVTLPRGPAADKHLLGAKLYQTPFIPLLYPPVAGDALSTDYALAIYCDTENHNSKGTDGVIPPLSTLTGKVSFKLTFAAGA